MKKFWIAFLIVLAIIIVAFAVLLIVANLLSNDDFTPKSYSSNENEINSIIVNVEDREIEIRQSSDEQIHIEYYESEKEYYSLFVNENNELTLNLVYNKNWLDYFRTKPNINYRKIYLQVPNNLLNNIQITTTNETIKLNDISVKENVILNSNGGNLEFDNLFAGKQINLVAKNGNITGSVIGDLNDFSISCNIKKGYCNLPTHKENGNKSLLVDCNNGDVNVDFVI